MDDAAPVPAMPAAPERLGDMLRVAREKVGLSLNEVAARTRVPVRHLQAIENDDYSALPSPTYASGFAKAYARAVNLDEVAVGRRVRGELAEAPRRTIDYQAYEAADPARVASPRLVVIATGIAIALLILAGLYFGTALLRPGGPTAPVVESAPPPAAAAPRPAPVAGVPTDGQVVVTATDEVWVRIYEADGKTLHQGTLKAGDSFDVPAGSNRPMINVGRPDKIRLTINGSAVDGLDLGRDPIKDVGVSAAALAARVAGTTASPERTDAASEPRPAAAEEGRAERRREPAPRASERRRRDTADEGSETRRANTDAARTPPAPAPAPDAAPGNTQ